MTPLMSQIVHSGTGHPAFWRTLLMTRFSLLWTSGAHCHLTLRCGHCVTLERHKVKGHGARVCAHHKRLMASYCIRGCHRTTIKNGAIIGAENLLHEAYLTMMSCMGYRNSGLHTIKSCHCGWTRASLEMAWVANYRFEGFTDTLSVD